jgi:hypothetical protein
MEAPISHQVARAEPIGASMGVLHDYYRAPDRSTAATTLKTPPVRASKRPDEPVFDAVDGKGIDPIVMLTTFQSLLTGVPYDELPQADFGDVAVGGDDGPGSPSCLRSFVMRWPIPTMGGSATRPISGCSPRSSGFPPPPMMCSPFWGSSSPWRAVPAPLGSRCTAGVVCSASVRPCRMGWQGAWDPGSLDGSPASGSGWTCSRWSPVSRCATG